MRVTWETLAAAALVAASILFIGRYQISAAGGGEQAGARIEIYRLDRWTGRVVSCDESTTGPGTTRIECPANDPAVQRAN
ncbi:MAG: hypothetical protein KGJ78_09005 [Alphaproteobacteria bacterium]|nr:hypothetical protein [Alphaproteobacteria bacterium]